MLDPHRRIPMIGQTECEPCDGLGVRPDGIYGVTCLACPQCRGCGVRPHDCDGRCHWDVCDCTPYPSAPTSDPEGQQHR